MTNIICIVPAALMPIPALIGKAIDTDTGGDLSFSIKAQDQSGTQYLISDAVSGDTFASQAAFLATSPMALFDYCNNELAIRFPEHEQITMQQAEEFCAAAKVFTGVSLSEVLKQANLTRTVQEVEP